MAIKGKGQDSHAGCVALMSALSTMLCTASLIEQFMFWSLPNSGKLCIAVTVKK